MSVIAVIPARGGSKGLSRKNIRNLCGKPLIAYSIETALNATLIDRVVVSTEDEEIANIANAFGAEVPFLRPADLATDTARPGDSIRYTLQRMLGQEINYTTAVSLYPTSPFRTPKMLDLLVDCVINQGFSYARTVKLLKRHRPGLIFQQHGGELQPLSLKNKLYRAYGTAEASMLTNQSKRTFYYPLSPLETLDIDTIEDFMTAEAVIKNKLYDFDESPELRPLIVQKAVQI